MLNVLIGLHDTLQIRLEGGDGSVLFSMKGRGSSEIPNDKGNLCVQAAIRLIERTQRNDVNILIELDKRIPAGGGFGGGSSNAAAVLSAVHEALGQPLAEVELAKLALSIGADVPYFLRGASQVCVGGIGEHLHIDRSSSLRSTPVFLILGLPHLGTPVVFQEAGYSTRMENSVKKPTNSFPEEYGLLLSLIQNDLEIAASSLCGLLKETLAALRALNCGRVGMTGSGSGVFILPKDQTGFHIEDVEKLEEYCLSHALELVKSSII